jgi:putative methionine-R-sulfoxide reductase with GAF domain
LADNPQTLRIWRLYRVVDKITKFVVPDWFGIYRKIINKTGKPILIKEAYAGAFSRAEFPLNEEFAAQSNNSTVGLNGKARYFSDLSAYTGPYYECDSKVQSEYCGPILNPDGDVIGIVDAESFQKNFFTPEKILQLTKVCRDLGEINLGLETAR